AVGVTAIYRLGPDKAFRQGLWIVIGVGVFAATLFWLRHDYRVLERYKYVFGVTAIFLLFLPLAPGIGETINGSRLWIHFGGLQFQPGELGKIALIVFLAAYFREKREVLAQGSLKDWGPLLVIWGGAMLVLFATDDLGSALLDRPRRLRRHRARPRDLHRHQREPDDPRPEHRLHLLGPGAGARAGRRRRGAAALHGLRRARLPGRPLRHRRILEAARGRAQ